MRISVTIIIAILSWILTGCGKSPSANDMLLDEAEALIEVAPDSASNILKSILLPEAMDDRAFARWCMLSGMITDNPLNSILPTSQLERAYDWYFSHGTPTEQVQISIFLGRSYAAEGDYDKAMLVYTDALEIGESNELNNLVGYTYSYMGDLYKNKFMRIEAIKKYEAAADYFKKENNTDSYACALRDMGREYARIDSTSRALEILFLADSVAANTKNIRISSSINNTIGNIYEMQNEYDKAEKYLLKSLMGGGTMPSRMALIDLYITTGSINKAKELLFKISQDDPQECNTYSFKYLSYRIYKAEENYKKALVNLEEHKNITDSIIYADAQSKIQEEVNELKNRQKKYIFISIICILTLLLVIVSFMFYRKKAKEKVEMHQAEVDRMKKKLLHDSFLYQELTRLINQKIPNNNKSLITAELWNLIEKEIITIYPKLHTYIYERQNPKLAPSDFRYCCLYLCEFGAKEESKLLGIAPDSAQRKRLRLKDKLNISLPANTSLCEYLIKNIR